MYLAALEAIEPPLTETLAEPELLELELELVEVELLLELLDRRVVDATEAEVVATREAAAAVAEANSLCNFAISDLLSSIFLVKASWAVSASAFLLSRAAFSLTKVALIVTKLDF